MLKKTFKSRDDVAGLLATKIPALWQINSQQNEEVGCGGAISGAGSFDNTEFINMLNENVTSISNEQKAEGSECT